MTRLTGGALTWRVALGLAAASLAACDPQKADWGFQSVTTLPTPPDAPALGCGVSLPADTLASQRAACAFGSGDRAAKTLGIEAATAAAIPIRHVIVLMKENRSFDHLLGQLHDQGNAGVAAFPAGFTNADLNGNAVVPFHQTNTCLADDPGHQSAQIALCVDGDKMDGFVRNAELSTGTDGHWAMGFYEKADLPFDYFLASTYAIGDNHFSPMASGTYGNRDFMMFGTNAGVVDTGLVYPPPTTPSILGLLLDAGFTWGAYSDSQPFSGALDWGPGDPGVHSMAQLYDALDQGTLPSVAFVDAVEYITDDHPDADLQAGEAWTKSVYDHAVNSPQWPRMAILWTYDEGGAFWDHVPPPDACVAEPDSPFSTMGIRVPLVAISPWAKRNHASHVLHDHTAITRFIELLFDLPALTARDANSDALLDLFDFSCGRDLSIPDAPEPGAGSCVDPAPPGTY